MSDAQLLGGCKLMFAVLICGGLAASGRAAEKPVNPNVPPSPFELAPAQQPRAYSPLSNTNSVGLKSPKMNPQGDMIFTNWPGFSQPLLVPRPTRPEAYAPQPSAPGAPTPSDGSTPVATPSHKAPPLLGVPPTYHPLAAVPTPQDLVRSGLQLSHPLAAPSLAEEELAGALNAPPRPAPAANAATSAKTKSAITTNQPPRASIWEQHKRVLEGVEYHW